MNDMNVLDRIIRICSNTRCPECPFAYGDIGTGLRCKFEIAPYFWDAIKILEIIRNIEENEERTDKK